MGGFTKGAGGASLDRRYAKRGTLAWTPIGGSDSPFAGNWQQNLFTSSGFRDAAYAIDDFGIVRLRGHVANTVAWSGTIATLPVAMRPTATESFVVPVLGTASVAGAAAVQIKTTGNIDFINATGTTWTATNWLSLSGISYAGA